MSLKIKTPTEPGFQGYSILIVDDTPVNLKVIVDFLEGYGFGIRIARSGASALKKVQYDPPDIILLDVLMPEMDGFETCRRLKADETIQDIPVIFMTSLTGAVDKVKGFEAGAVDYVTKPLHQEEVLARITTHLRLRDLALDLQQQNKQLEASNRVEKARLFEAVSQQRKQLQALNQKLTEIQEAERKRLARELHDEMGQALTAIGINLVAIQKELAAGSQPRIKERLAEAISLTDQTQEQIRELSLNLRPPMLDDLGLDSTLRWYVKRYARRVNIQTELDMVGLDGRLSANIETTLFRVVQEALTNVARHAKAGQVRLHLRRKRMSVRVIIEDDGQGFDVAALVMDREDISRGVGLLGMRERVAQLGGQFEIESKPGGGTCLIIEIPVLVPVENGV